MKTKEHSAEAELEQAEQAVSEVLERIKAGDEKVGPGDLEAAERRVRFAQARLEGEERRQAEEDERDRLQRLQELEARAIKDLDQVPVRKARAKAEKAVGDYIDAIAAHNQRIAEIAEELDGLAPLPDDMATGTSSYGLTVTLAGQEHRPRREVVLVADLAREQLRARVRGIIDLEEPV